MEKIYVKNNEGTRKIYLKIEPVFNPHDDYAYEGTEVATQNGEWMMDTYALTYRDLRRMYEEGFHTIEPEEFESIRSFAQADH